MRPAPEGGVAGQRTQRIGIRLSPHDLVVLKGLCATLKTPEAPVTMTMVIVTALRELHARIVGAEAGTTS